MFLSSSKRDTRLLNIIHELKTYKKRLSTKIDDTRRNVEPAEHTPGIDCYTRIFIRIRNISF